MNIRHDRLLASTVKNVETGIYTIPMILKSAKSKDFRKLLIKQYREYVYYRKKLEGFEEGYAAGLSFCEKTRLGFMTELNCLCGCDSKLASALAVGTLMGLIDLKKNIGKSDNPKLKSLCSSIYRSESNAIADIFGFI